jgi:putative transposase
MDIYRKNAHARSVGWSTWHLEWCTKYRYKIFVTAQLRELCLIAIGEAAKQHRIDIIDAECDRDHVHVVAALPLTMPPTTAVRVLKSISAIIILHQAPHIRRLYRGKCLWSPGKFAGSVGHITLEKAKKYLEEHHAKSAHNHQESQPRTPQREGSPARAGEGLPLGGRQL